MVATLSRAGTGWSLSDQRSYDAWGQVRAGVANGDPSGRYCASLGHKQDDESGLIYMRARYYEPSSGRFISQDPSGQGTNWYVYCGNNPIASIDSTGRSYEDLYTLFTTASNSFKDGLKAAWDTGEIDQVIHFIVDNWPHEAIAFSTGGIWHRLAAGYGLRLRIQAIMLEELLGEGVIENAGYGIVTTENELSGIGRLVMAANSAHEVGE